MSLVLNLVIDVLALGIEGAFGYPTPLFTWIGHPVVWLGALVRNLDRRFNLDTDPPEQRQRKGVTSVVILLLVAGLAALAFHGAVIGLFPRAVALVLLGLVASSCLAQRSLNQHVGAVREALDTSGLTAGRAAVSMIVGRDTAILNKTGVCRAAIESLAENFADGIVAPSLYLGLGGLVGGFVYKAINTADSMIGHRTPRHEAFGFAAAKVDDVVNWPAARLAGFWIVLAAFIVPGESGRAAWRVMRRDAKGHPSPNAGWPEAAMAGALGVKLGGPRAYGGLVVQDAAMNEEGLSADADTIGRALILYRVACGLNAVAILLTAFLIGIV